jgi:acetyl esterase
MAMPTPTTSGSMPDSTSTGVLLEPTTQSFIDALTAAGGPPLYTLSLTAACNVVAGRRPSPWRRWMP